MRKLLINCSFYHRTVYIDKGSKFIQIKHMPHYAVILQSSTEWYIEEKDADLEKELRSKLVELGFDVTNDKIEFRAQNLTT